MTYLLTNHANDYHLSKWQKLLCAVTMSNIPFAVRHVELAISEQKKYWFGHIVLAIIECLPGLGIIVSTIEYVVASFFKTKTSLQPIKNNQSLTLDTEINRLFDPDSYTGQITRKDGPKALLRYLNQPQPYNILTAAATWGLPPTIFGKKVVLGHHTLIHLPGKRIVEWAAKKSPTIWEGLLQRITQLETRTATGKQIEKMWSTHCRLIPKYHQWGILNSAPEGMLHYRPFKNDCVTYADRVLTENGQAPSHLNRLYNTDYAFSLGDDAAQMKFAGQSAEILLEDRFREPLSDKAMIEQPA
jgi:hypothetical protein